MDKAARFGLPLLLGGWVGSISDLATLSIVGRRRRRRIWGNERDTVIFFWVCVCVPDHQRWHEKWKLGRITSTLHARFRTFWRRFACSVSAYQQKFLHRSSVGTLLRECVVGWAGSQNCVGGCGNICCCAAHHHHQRGGGGNEATYHYYSLGQISSILGRECVRSVSHLISFFGAKEARALEEEDLILFFFLEADFSWTLFFFFASLHVLGRN